MNIESQGNTEGSAANSAEDILKGVQNFRTLAKGLRETQNKIMQASKDGNLESSDVKKSVAQSLSDLISLKMNHRNLYTVSNNKDIL